MGNKIKICIAGKNNIAVKVTEYIAENYPGVEIVACCNATDDGKNSFQRSFKSYCLQNKIPILSIDEVYFIKNLIFLSLEFDKIIKPSLFISPYLYNIHFSFLPEYKGMYTSALPIINGELYSGVTLHKIDEGIDTGEIIDQIRIELKQDITAQELYDEYIRHGIFLVIKNIKDILNHNVNSSPQTPVKSSYYSKKAIDYNNLKINLNKTAFEIKNQIHAYVFPSYQMPEIHGYKIRKAFITEERSKSKFGTLIENQEFFFIISTIDYNVKLYKDKKQELFQTAIDGDLLTLNKFIDNQYDIFQKNKEGWDIAIISAYHGKFDYLEFLIDKLDWDINTTNNNGTTLLMYIFTHASINDSNEFLKLFIKKYKPNLFIKDFYGNDVFYYARKSSCDKIIELLEKYSN